MRLIAPLAASLIAAVLASPADARSRPYSGVSSVCATGYHVDGGGNCQPNAAQQDRYCARGTVFHPEPWGWNCEPAPRGY